MKRLLIIDDDIRLLQIMRRWLEKAGYDVLAALDGNMALSMQRQTPADLIITDIFMPEKEGTELIMELRQEFPRTKIIVITGGGSVDGLDYLELSRNLGAHRTFNKPFSREDLLRAIQELLGEPDVLSRKVGGKRNATPHLSRFQS